MLIGLSKNLPQRVLSLLGALLWIALVCGWCWGLSVGPRPLGVDAHSLGSLTLRVVCWLMEHMNSWHVRIAMGLLFAMRLLICNRLANNTLELFTTLVTSLPESSPHTCCGLDFGFELGLGLTLSL